MATKLDAWESNSGKICETEEEALLIDELQQATSRMKKMFKCDDQLSQESQDFFQIKVMRVLAFGNHDVLIKDAKIIADTTLKLNRIWKIQRDK